MRKALLHLKNADPVLGQIIEQVGAYKIRADVADFRSLARAIVFQQLHGKAASTIFARLLALTGDPITPQGVLKLSIEQMRSAGLSKQKLSYLRDLAERTHRGELDFTRMQDMQDEEVIEMLTQVKGVGVWTAHMFLMFALRRPNVLPVGDLGIQTAIRKHYKKRKALKAKQMEKIAKCWEPYRSVACWYLWRSLDVKPPEV